MSGSNTMCIATVLLETGMVPMVEPRDPVPARHAGRPCRHRRRVPRRQVRHRHVEERAGVRLRTRCGAGDGGSRFDLDRHRLRRDDLRHRRCRRARLRGRPRRSPRPCRAGRADPHGGARPASRRRIPSCPTSPTCRSCSSPVRSLATGNRVSARNTCIVSPGRSDRSPTGTGTTARMAVLHARGVLQVGGGTDSFIDHRLGVPRHDRRRDHRRPVPGDRGHHPRPGLDHRLAPLLRRCR